MAFSFSKALPLQGIFAIGHPQQRFQPEFEVTFSELLLNRAFAQLLSQGKYVAVDLAKASHLALQASDLGARLCGEVTRLPAAQLLLEDPEILALGGKCALDTGDGIIIKDVEIGRASCRERV